MQAATSFNPELLRSTWWPRLVIFGVAAFALWTLVKIAVLLLGGPDLPPPVSAGPAPISRAPTSSVPLAQWHLFGNAGAAPDLARLVQTAPETPLRLSLRGTLNIDATDGGMAIIADEQGKEAAYRVGDSVPGEATLTAIYAGRVLLSRAGRDEGLSLRPDLGAAASDSDPNRRAALPGQRPTNAPGFVNPQLSFGAPSLETLRARTGTDIAELAKQVNVLPVVENGRFAGVRLNVGRDSDILVRTGIRSTDIITAVNGIPLDGPHRQAELLNALRDARQLTLTVRRDGQTQTLAVGL
ncbi:type II secretion system protein GspC [Pseudomarimonas arenosa]|uniref:Type II secretion system protein GspC n=1 Tax=Pseudomarimonas arenosa TaxID=2774145 RepID=A0AAW3ZKK2_9GAMM|nr:type II secretion system protein GspC [Pseudomarimonas arenosa]MBD8525224.1 type II secretion system protein GspC [Pseudomarimonas arenosa]